MIKQVVGIEKLKKRHSALEKLFQDSSLDMNLSKLPLKLMRAGKTVTLSHSLSRSLAFAQSPRKLVSVSEELLSPVERSIIEVTGTASRDGNWNDLEDTGTIAIALPIGFDYGMVSVETFKAMANRPNDALFQKNGNRWDILEDDALVNLADRSKVYKLGLVAFLS